MTEDDEYNHHVKKNKVKRPAAAILFSKIVQELFIGSGSGGHIQTLSMAHGKVSENTAPTLTQTMLI